MLLPLTPGLVILTFLSLSLCSGLPYNSRIDFPIWECHRRSLIDAGSLSESYDYIVVGGGTAGLVLAARLSENPSTSVLVLEAGSSGEEAGDRFARPGNTYYNSSWFSQYDWAYKTVPQKALGDRQVTWPRGKLLGGSSATNGMYLVRPSEADVKSWETVVSSMDTNAISRWKWDSFFAAMKNMESFGSPKDDIATIAGIKYDAANHGSSGPIHHSYPGFMLSQVGSWSPALNALGVPTIGDAYGGKNVGAFIATSAINPSNWTRSYSKSGYLDPLPPRSNLHILTQATATRIVFDDSSPSDNKKATGVEWAIDAFGEKKTVKINKEVILSAGTVGSPQLLMLSGVGPKDVLDAANIKVNAELPGVGQHLQEHCTVGMMFSASGETAGDIKAINNDFSNTPEFLSYVNSAVAYLNLTTIFGGSSANVNPLLNEMKSGLDSAATSVPSSDSSVVEGFKSVYSAVVDGLANSETGAVEILLSVTTAGKIQLQVALQHPLSHGRIYVNSSSVFDKAVIDPQYYLVSQDLVVHRQGAKFIRLLSQTAPLNTTIKAEEVPGPDVQTDEQWETWMKTAVSTEFHPTGTCAMLLKGKGGVVDANLKVYNLANVRVIDGSVFPVQFSAHLGEPTYALAELGASILTGSGSGSNNSSNSNSNDSNSGSNNRNAAQYYGPSTLTIFVAVLTSCAYLLS